MPLLAVFFHNIDPFAIRFTDDFGIRWYGLSYLLGFFIAYLLIKRVVRAGVSTLKPEEVGDLIVTLALGVVIGGRLGYVFFYSPSLLTAFDSQQVPYWGVLMINKGGMASHGGMIGGIIASWYYAWKHNHSWPHILDLFAFGAPLGLFFGRIANFIHGELFGRPVREGSIAMHWAVKFPQEMYLWDPENSADAAKLETLIRQAAPLVKKPTEFLAAGSDEQIRTVIGLMQKGNQSLRAVVEPLLTPRHPSQLYEALLEGLVLFTVLAIVWWKPRKPLVIGATFAITYGIVRIIGEVFRMPDAPIAHEEFQHFGVTRGQWLSALLMLAGVIMLVLAQRRRVAPMGSWRKQP